MAAFIVDSDLNDNALILLEGRGIRQPHKLLKTKGFRDSFLRPVRGPDGPEFGWNLADGPGSGVSTQDEKGPWDDFSVFVERRRFALVGVGSVLGS